MTAGFCWLISLLKNAIVAFFHPRQVRSTARKMPISSSFWHRIHAMTQPVDFFNGLLSAAIRGAARVVG
jgi:hypothetical protein